MQSATSTNWRPAAPEQEFCPGDKVRTLERSRATLQLSDETYLALDQKTTVIFAGLKPQAPSWLDLLKGVMYLRSRTPRPLDIRTPFVNALIKGTEFLVASDEEQGQVTVFDGVVEAYNPQGSLTLTDGQTAVAKAGLAPARKISLRLEDAVQWALYYPPLFDLARLEKAPSRAVRQAVSRYLAGDLEGALVALDPAPDDASKLLRAELLLSFGRVDEAEPLLASLARRDPTNGEAVALQAIIALAKNDLETARRLARQAVSLAPDSPVPWTAISYVQQAGFRLDDALQSARQAAERDPRNVLAQTRLAELYASLGRLTESRKAAEEAIALSPRSTRARAVMGYVQLMSMDAKKAERSFRDAIMIDSSDPLSRFGLGLAKIRRGQLKEGTADLEMAASLDPSDALFRSYLGKAYYDQKRGNVAETELAIAKSLDPKDPTPWFYDAVKKQTENRPVEALHDLQKSIELNDNRAVYRSRQMLDDDLAARSSALGRIYNELDFGQRAVFEGWRSVNTDPANYSAHRFLADTYANLPRHEIARVSELLQSQLLQPINVTPVQPQLAESSLFIPPGSGPQAVSFTEFNPLFSRNRYSLLASGVAGNHNTLGDEVVHSGVIDNFSYSVGQFHFETDGFRENNWIRTDLYNVFLQASLSPQTSVQGEWRNSNKRNGEIRLQFDQSLSRDFNEDTDANNYRFGLRHAFSPESRFIASFIYQDLRFNQFKQINSFMPTTDLEIYRRGYSAEIQQSFEKGRTAWILGGGRIDQAIEEDTQIRFPLGFSFTDSADFNFEKHNLYSYSNITLSPWFSMTAGLSADFVRFGKRIDRNQVNPKLGFIWRPTPKTAIRAAGFRVLASTQENFFTQTIEPTQVAGFNQFFDDKNGSDVWRYGLGIDHQLGENAYVGAEWSERKIDSPLLASSTESARFLPWDERLVRTYVSWMPTSNLAGTLEYFFEKFEIDPNLSEGIVNTDTHRVPLSINYFHPSGLSLGSRITYINQSGRFTRKLSDEQFEGREEFWTVDLKLQFRFPKQYGLASFTVKNLFDEKFNFQDTDPSQPLLVPERMFFGQLTVSF